MEGETLEGSGGEAPEKVIKEEQRKPSERELMMDMIAGKRTESINSELAEANSEQRIEVPAGDEPPKADHIYEFLGEEDLGKKIKLKVDGQEQEVSLSDIIAEAQKGAAASKRLEEATSKLNEANRILAEADAARKAEEGAGTGAATKANEISTETPSLEIKDAVQQAVSLIYEGDQEKATEALTSALTSIAQRTGGGATVNVDEVVKQVTTQMAWDGAIDKFLADDADIAKDPVLSSLWKSHLNAETPKSASPEQAVSAATSKVREWMTQHGIASPKPSGAGQGSRETLKREAGKHQFSASSDIASPSGKVQETAQPTPTSIVRDIAAARGQRM